MHETLSGKQSFWSLDVVIHVRNSSREFWWYYTYWTFCN